VSSNERKEKASAVSAQIRRDKGAESRGESITDKVLKSRSEIRADDVRGSRGEKRAESRRDRGADLEIGGVGQRGFQGLKAKNDYEKDYLQASRSREQLRKEEGTGQALLHQGAKEERRVQKEKEASSQQETKREITRQKEQGLLDQEMKGEMAIKTERSNIREMLADRRV
jgi:hypothetical protein